MGSKQRGSLPDNDSSRAAPTLHVDTSPLFPGWANGTFRLVLLALLLSPIAIPTLFIAWARTPYSTGASEPQAQPVLFDHRHHTRDDGIDCRYCHNSVERSPYAGVPSSEVCMNCHGQVWNDAPLLSAVRASYFDSAPLEWQRVFNVPDFVFFNHAVHVHRNVGCVSCHGGVDAMGQVYMPVAMTMSWCLDCHRAPEKQLRSADRISEMDFLPPDEQLEVGLAIKTKNQIEPPTNCSACHR
jgi:hypothetical protein